MKRYHVNQETLKAIYPPMEERFERQMQGILASLPGRERRRARLSGGRIAVIALLATLALAVSALAYAMSQGLFESMLEIELPSGVYVEWSRAQKEMLFATLMEYGELEDERMQALIADGKLGAKEEEELDALVLECYANRDMLEMVTLDDVMLAEIGEFDNEWPLDKKAAYSSLMDEVGMLASDDFVHMVPNENALTPEAAGEIALEHMAQLSGMDRSALQVYTINFGEIRSDVGKLPPYYVFSVFGLPDDFATTFVCIADDGRVLTSEDGYHYVVSPQETLEEAAAAAQNDALPRSERLEAHRALLESVPARTVKLDIPALAQGAIPLADGSSLIYGSVIGAETRAPLALCLDAQGNQLWLAELERVEGESACVQGAMQLENGDILLFVNRRDTQGQEILYDDYEQIRLSADGEVLEGIALRTNTEIFGIADDIGSLYAEPGHGGFLVHGAMGPKHIRCYAQLDERGETVFMLTLEELRGMAAYMYAAPQGYLLAAWDESAGTPIYRRYDLSGALVSESANDPALSGIRATDFYFEDDGSFALTSHFAGSSESLFADAHSFARIDGDNRLIERRTDQPTHGMVIKTSRILPVGGRYVFASEHWISEHDASQHCGLMIAGEDSSLAEVYPVGLAEDGPYYDLVDLVPAGENGVAVVLNTWVDPNDSLEDTWRRICVGYVTLE